MADVGWKRGKPPDDGKEYDVWHTPGGAIWHREKDRAPTLVEMMEMAWHDPVSPYRRIEERGVTVEEAKRVLRNKREQLVAYQNGIDDDDESVSRRHARVIAEGRLRS